MTVRVVLEYPDRRSVPPHLRYAIQREDAMNDEKCTNGHVWTHQFGDDWTPEHGRPCDCGQKRWGVPLSQAREHEWEFYANGSFCRRCGAAIGSGQPCR